MSHAAATPQTARRDPTLRSHRFVVLVVFLAGIGTLGIEMIASRLLAPFFGSSQPIWAAVIGMTLIYLAVGYHFGGRLADRFPDERMLYQLIMLSGVCAGCIPILAYPILSFSHTALQDVAIGGFLGALLGVLLLFAAPVTLLAMVGPFAVRLQIRRAEAGITGAGRTAGTISAISTLGSIIGTFLTVLVLIPALGTAATTYLYAVFLALLGLIGLRDLRYLVVPVLIGALAALTLAGSGPLKAAGCAGCTLIAERESLYNYIQVARREHPEYGEQHVLLLNEGLAVHSIANTRFTSSNDPLDTLTGGGPWDYFAIAPFVYPERSPDSVQSLLMLGAGAGTVPAQFLAIYGPDTRIDAVEIDPQIIAVGRDYFGLRDASVAATHPNYRAIAEDARYWLAVHGGIYDVIGVDAYHQPYIPFHLTTVEFFQLTNEHLAPDGVVVVNAGLGPNGDDRLSRALAATMRRVFSEVYVLETRRAGNHMLVGVKRPVGDGLANMLANYERMEHPALRQVIEWVRVPEQQDAGVAEVFTDDRAPVERLIDSLIMESVVRVP